MFFPGVRRFGLHLPHAAIPFLLALGAISLTLFAWGLFAPSVGRDLPAITGPEIGSVRSVAFTLPGPTTDDVVVRPLAPGFSGRVIASFPSGGPAWPHARGSASPLGTQVAVLWLPVFATRANLAIVDIPSGDTRQLDGSFDYFSTVAWSADGARLAVTETSGEAGDERITVFEVDAGSLTRVPVAEFAGALDIAPVGYSFDGARLFIVVVDQRGSNLYVERGGKTELVAELSPGRTRSWALSPDGSRLAFVDELSGGSRTYVGRTLLIANKSITTLPAERDQLGAAWVPGSPVPQFGGPGGSLQFTAPEPEAAYLVPEAWSPDGSHLAARVYLGESAKGAPLSTVLELISRETASTPSVRVRLTDVPGAEFLGFVRDLN